MQPTEHARSRCQQRGISPMVVDLLVRFGAEVRSHGASKYYLDRKARSALAKTMGREALRRYEHKLNCYVIVADDGMLVTAALRTTRIKH
jgi:hypothetical protein